MSAGAPGEAELRLNATGRRLLRRARTLRVRITETLRREGKPARLTNAYTVTVRLARRP